MRIVTKTNVNIRSGPSMIFDIVGHANKGTVYSSIEFRKDAESMGWYKVDNGWVCAQYVAVTGNAVANQLEPNLRKHDEDDEGDDSSEGEGGTVDVTGDQSQGLDQAADADQTQRSTTGEATTGLAGNFLSRKIFGLPYQYRPTVDMRVDGADSVLGVEYLTMLAEAPYISVLPGKPLFLPDIEDDKKSEYLKVFNDMINPLTDTLGRVLPNAESVLTDKDMEIRYFGFTSDYNTYMQYVNTMCWMIATTMGIADSLTVPGYENDEFGSVGKFDWQRWRMANNFAGTPTEDSVTKATEGGDSGSNRWESLKNSGSIQDAATEAWTLMMEEASREEYYTDFYINPNISYSESFQNTTSTSMLEGAVSQASEMAKELGFLMNAGVGAANANQSQEELGKILNEAGSKITGNSGVLKRLLGSASTVISGYNIAFPEIWKSSDYSRSFNIEVNLRTPYGTKEAIFFDLMVPLAHWLCLAMPRQHTINSYGAPFLVKCFIPGFCSVDMGIVESLSISKGGDGSAWSVEGFPLEMTLSIQIKDLYSSMMMSRINFVSPKDIYNFVWNTGFLDYLAVQGGLNMKCTEAANRAAFVKSIVSNQFDARYVGNRAIDIAKEEIRNSIWNKIFKR